MLCEDVSVNHALGMELRVKFASVCEIEVAKVDELLSVYGNGYVYAPGGFALPYRESLVQSFVKAWGKCVVVLEDGTIKFRERRERHKVTSCEKNEKVVKYLREKNYLKCKEGKAVRAKKRAAERKQFIVECEERRRMAMARRMFHDGAGVPCPKRGGKANSRSDMGRYNNYPNTRLADWEHRKPELAIVRAC